MVADQDTEDYQMCPRCRCCGMVWQECEECGGEGETAPGELHDIDPLWYDMEDTEPCDVCRGQGGWYVCGGGCDEDGKHKPEGRP